MRFVPFDQIDNNLLDSGITDHLIKVADKYAVSGMQFLFYDCRSRQTNGCL